ncbi:MAG TPA: creatininase family protein [Bacillota bacterium]
MSVWLHEQRWPQVAEYLRQQDIVLIPVGSTEQHGRHLPVGVDALVAIRLAVDAAVKTGVLVAPPLWYGFAPQHMAFPGTVTLRPETLSAVVEDVGISLIHHGFRKLVLVNGHRIANLPPLQIAAARIRNRTGAYVGIVDPVYIGHEIHRTLLADPEAGGLSHAEGLETAHMLHLHPELVDRRAIPARAAGAAAPHPPFHILDPFRPGDRVIHMGTPRETAAVTLDGAAGNPAWGTAERGQRLHQELVERLAAYLEELKGYPVDGVRADSYPI